VVEKQGKGASLEKAKERESLEKGHSRAVGRRENSLRWQTASNGGKSGRCG
jgi:hypothetical protein